jgi:alpha-D-xyloside xylohydrolase
MRPLFIDYPDDPASWQVDDQLLFGPEILVAPIYAPGQTARSVYLPDGQNWTDTATGQTHAGGVTVTAAAPIERIPIFVAEGSAVRGAVAG